MVNGCTLEHDTSTVGRKSALAWLQTSDAAPPRVPSASSCYPPPKSLSTLPMGSRSLHLSGKTSSQGQARSPMCNSSCGSSPRSSSLGRRSCSSTTRPQTRHQHRQLEVCARLVPSKRRGGRALKRHTSNVGLKSALAWFHSIADAASCSPRITAAHAQRLSYPHAPLQRNSSQFCLKGALCMQDSSNPWMRDHHAGSTSR